MTIREQFPFFNNNQQTVYLDSAATTQKPQIVIDSIIEFYTKQNANTHRSNSNLANKVTTHYEQTRKKVAHFIGADSADDIVWTKGTTDAINLVAQAWGENNVSTNDTIIVLGSEHHANFVPWQQLAKRKNANFQVVNLLDDGMPDLEHYKELLELKPKIVALQHCSNALGNIHTVKQLVAMEQEKNAVTLVDSAQAIDHISVDVKDIN